jgi:hypothetical protein
MAIIRIPTKTLEAHKQIPQVLKQEFPDLERIAPIAGFEQFKTLISRDKAIIPIFHYHGGKLYLKALI